MDPLDSAKMDSAVGIIMHLEVHGGHSAFAGQLKACLALEDEGEVVVHKHKLHSQEKQDLPGN
jgi:hypothetical protein